VEQAETLAVGSGRHHRWRPGRLLVIVLAALLLVVGSAAYVVDRDRRGREGRALEACQASVVTAHERAIAPVLAMAQYVRPVLDSTSSDRLRADMLAMISATAERSDRRLAAARRECLAVEVWWFHEPTRTRRLACIRAAQASQRYLRDVADDGAALTHHQPHGTASCARG
jgi:hypothetical protein